MGRWLVVCLSIALFSCDKSSVSEAHKDIPNLWQADSIVAFKFHVPDNMQHYNLYFYVRNGVEFPHSNLYFKYWLKDSTNTILETELLNMPMFNSKSGYPLGNGIGDLFEHKFEILTNYTFPASASYIIEFQQYMRYDSLPEIYSVGYRLEQSIPQHSN